jgi:stage II sporulation protein R
VRVRRSGRGSAALLVLAAGCALALARTAAVPRLGPGTIQLRVIGASDAPAAQALKLQVRDVVLAALAPGLRAAATPQAAAAYVRAELPAVRAVARAAAARGGETARVAFGPAALPARRLGLLAFPAGTAPALVVTLGAGRGHNWWTVLFPPLALVTVRGDLVVVGPGGAAEPVADLSAAERQALLDAISGQTGVALATGVAPASGGAAAVTVQVRFLVWDLLRSLPWRRLGA